MSVGTPQARELAARESDGVHVVLLWHPRQTAHRFGRRRACRRSLPARGRARPSARCLLPPLRVRRLTRAEAAPLKGEPPCPAPSTAVHEARTWPARMGRWSAAHWKTATFGWLAFVVVAFALGGMVGTKTIDPNTPGRASPAGWTAILDAGLQAARRRERPRSRAARSARPTRPSRPRSRTSSRRLRGSTSSRTSARRSTRRTRARSRRTGTRRSSSSRSAATPTRPRTRSTRSSTEVDEAQQAHPELFIGEFGDASAVKAVETAFADDLAKAGQLSLPITLIILVVAFGALVAAGIPLLLALTAVVRDLRPGRADQPGRCRWRRRPPRSCS